LLLLCKIIWNGTYSSPGLLYNNNIIIIINIITVIDSLGYRESKKLIHYLCYSSCGCCVIWNLYEYNMTLIRNSHSAITMSLQVLW